MNNVNVPGPQKEFSRVGGSNANISPSQTSQSMEEINFRHYKKTSSSLGKYKECLKNHAAAIGGNATDGCGEFMPSGEEGTIEALKCSACDCHRNFHRKEAECDCSFDCYHSPVVNNGRKLILGPHNYLIASRAEPVSYKGIGSNFPSESDEKEDAGPIQKVRKRFRTKFTQEQKEKMLKFAERAEWRIQRLDESIVQQFCQELGIKRRVLKVWMHNNKHNLAKKIDSTT